MEGLVLTGPTLSSLWSNILNPIFRIDFFLFKVLVWLQIMISEDIYMGQKHQDGYNAG